MMKKGQKQYGQEFRNMAVRYRAAGKTKREIAELMGVSFEVIKEMLKCERQAERRTAEQSPVKDAQARAATTSLQVALRTKIMN